MLLGAVKILSAGFSIIALGGVAIGIGIIFGSLLIAVSRNPTIKEDLLKLAIFGFALTEAMALFALLMSFLFLFGI